MFFFFAFVPRSRLVRNPHQPEDLTYLQTSSESVVAPASFKPLFLWANRDSRDGFGALGFVKVLVWGRSKDDKWWHIDYVYTVIFCLCICFRNNYKEIWFLIYIYIYREIKALAWGYSIPGQFCEKLPTLKPSLAICVLFVEHMLSWMKSNEIPSRELTYPPKMAFWRWFSFSQGGIC